MFQSQFTKKENTELHVVQQKNEERFQLLIKINFDGRDICMVSKSSFREKELESMWPTIKDEFAQACGVIGESDVPLIEFIIFYKFYPIGTTASEIQNINTHKYLH